MIGICLLLDDLRKSGIKPADQNNRTTQGRIVNQSWKITDLDYINFLVAAQCDVSCVKAAECYSVNGLVVAHDKINRFLTRQSLTPETLWNEVEPYIEKRSRWLIVDDTVIDKIHSKQIELTYYQWSGKHHSVVKGIGLNNPSRPGVTIIMLPAYTGGAPPVVSRSISQRVSGSGGAATTCGPGTRPQPGSPSRQ